MAIRLPELPRSQRERLFKEGTLVSISEIFPTLPDPRRPQGRRYELAYLLTCLGSSDALSPGATPRLQ